MAYLGNSPGVASQRVESAFTATSSQTVFTPTSGYTLGYCDVYQNGVKLVNGDDYTAADGATVTLATGAATGDSIVIVASFPRGLSDGYLKSEADAKYAPIAAPTFTGVATFSKGSTSGVTIGDVTTNSNSVLRMQGTSAGKNWQIANNLNVAGIEFTPSTADGGTTYTTPTVTFLSSGSVGIGNTSPAYKLDVGAATDLAARVSTTGTSNSASVILQSGNGTTSGKYSYARFINNDTNGQDWRIGTYGTDNFYFVNAKTSNVPIVVSTSGGIGLNGTPSDYYLLDTQATGADYTRSVRLGTVNLGQSGGDYPWVGYNFRATTTSGTYKFNVGDYASAIRFQAGTVETYTTTSVGTAGNTISFVLGPYLARGGASWLAGSSDVRQKKNFEPSQGLAELMQVEAVKYHFEWDEDTAPKRLGFKAQNLLPIIPEMVVEKDKLHEDGTPLLTIAPDYMLPVLVKAIQEQQAIIEQLQADVATLKGTP